MLKERKIRMQLLFGLGPFTSLALVLFLMLGGFDHPDLDFVEGFLVGLSIVGNLAYIYVTTRYLRDQRRQKCSMDNG